MGLFDNMPDPNGDQTLTPGPALDALFPVPMPAQAQPPVPLPIMAPSVSQDPRQKLLQLGSIIAALIGGPHSNLGGLPTGVLRGQQIAQQEADRQATIRSQTQARQESQQLAQQRIADQEQQQRQRQLAVVADQVPKFDNKEQYDRYINFAEQTMGLPTNRLRTMFPFVAPTAERRAKKLLDAWFKNDANREALKKDPGLAQRAVVQFDANGDGIPENVPLVKLGEIAQSPFAMGANGQPVTLGPDISGDKFHVAVQNEVAKFTATNGRPPSPQDMDAIITEAAKVGKDPEVSGLNLDMKRLQAELAQQRLETLRTQAQPVVINAGSPEYRVAQDLAYGKLTFTQLRSLYSYSRDINKKLALYDKARELNPDFNPAEFEAGYRLASNPKVRQQLASMDNVQEATPDLIRVSDEATRSGITALNGIVNKGGYLIGGKRYSNFRIAVTAYADELSGALGYGSATDMSREMGFNMTDPNLSPANFASGMRDIVVPFIERKRATLLRQMGPYGQSNPSAQPKGGRFEIIQDGK